MLRIMERRMFTTTNNFKITKSIILNIMVFMVNNFVKLKFSSKMSFHLIPMFSYVAVYSAISFLFWNPHKNISKVVYLSSTFPMPIKMTLSSAFKRAKTYFVSSPTMKPIGWLSTIFTRWSWYVPRHIHTIDGDWYNVK